MKANIINILFLLLFFISSLFLNKLFFSILLSIIAILSLKEVLSIRKGDKHFPIQIELIAYIITLFLVFHNYYNRLDFFLIDYKLLVVLLLSAFIPLVLINNKKKYNILDALYIVGTTLFIGITFNLLLQYRNYNINYVSYIIFIALSLLVFENITSYFIGKTVFLPTINPKKTLEGVLSGIIISTILSTMFFMRTIITDLPLHGIIFVSFSLSVFGEFGNLIFTFIKKEFNKSNFCNYNSKFSGILDIIDSVVLITLSFILFITFL